MIRPTHTAKQQAIEAIEQLPDNVALDEIVYRLYGRAQTFTADGGLPSRPPARAGVLAPDDRQGGRQPW